MSEEREYVLGTHDEELVRLRLQHLVWRPRALDAWRRAGFTIGQRLIDVGCGPGYATLDLADIVSPTGRVIGIDGSARFLAALDDVRGRRGVDNIDTRELDLNVADLPARDLDGAWCRWVFAFLRNRKEALKRVCESLRRGGAIVIHEYFDYSTWRMAPRCEEIEEYVAAVMTSWRAEGGEPDVALDLPRWLAELGYEIKSLQPIVDIVPASSFVWQWPKTFVEVGLKRLVKLGRLTPDRAQVISNAMSDCEAAPHTLMITPAVLEIIAVRR